MAAKQKIFHHWQLEVFQLAREVAQQFFQVSRRFPKEEIYSLTDQGRRASRAVSAMIAGAWRRRKYEAAFVNKLNEAEGEAAETQTWIEYSVRCCYITAKEGRELHRTYDRILGKLVKMQNNPDVWLLPRLAKRA